MRLLKTCICATLFSCLIAITADAQFFSVCRDGSEDDLVLDIVAHSEHAWRLEEKIRKYYYNNDPLPAGLKDFVLDDVKNFIRNTDEKRKSKTAVLFHAVGSDNEKLCTWLITGEEIISHVSPAPKKEYIKNKQTSIMHALGVTRMAKSRSPVLRGAMVAQQESSPPPISEKAALKEISDWLLPCPINDALDYKNIQTLVVVPIFDFGTLPFAAFDFRNDYLVDHMSISIAPSFRIFTDEKKMARQRSFTDPIIVGDPCDNECYRDSKWIFNPLKGARTEANEIAGKFPNTDALIGSEATRENVKFLLKERSKSGLVFLATHGIADEKNPNDESFLLLSDGRWTAREIYNDTKEAKLESGFLAVMSACQTGLGKVFDVGNTGLARAWHSAGAANVVMSLWNVHDDATRLLMTKFIEFAKQMPPDMALQKAMQEARRNNQYFRPVYWAGFNVFGAP
jgi:CHAT domain-containing protein